MPVNIFFLIRSSSLQGRAFHSLRSELRQLVRPGRRLVLDLAGVEALNTAGAALILDIARRLQSCQGSLLLVGVSRKAKLLLEMLRMHRVVEMHESPSALQTAGLAA